MKMLMMFRTDLAHERCDSEFLQTVLPRTEKYLESCPELLPAVQHQAEQAQYRAAMDMMLVTFLPDFAPHMAAFYAGEGMRLSELVSAKTLKAIDQHLLNCATVLNVAYRQFQMAEWEAGRPGELSAYKAALLTVTATSTRSLT